MESSSKYECLITKIRESLLMPSNETAQPVSENVQKKLFTNSPPASLPEWYKSIKVEMTSIGKSQPKTLDGPIYPLYETTSSKNINQYNCDPVYDHSLLEPQGEAKSDKFNEAVSPLEAPKPIRYSFDKAASHPKIIKEIKNNEAPKMNIQSVKKDEVLSLFQNAITQAFDEGAESPFEFRNTVVRNLTEQTIKAIDKLNLENSSNSLNPDLASTLAQKISQYIPTPIWEILKQIDSSYIAGGWLIKTLLGLNNRKLNLINWKKSDLDIFCDMKNFEKTRKIMSKAGYVLTKWPTKKQLVYDYTSAGAVGSPDGTTFLNSDHYKITPSLTLNIIGGNFDTPQSVVENFDFLCLQQVLHIKNSQNYLQTSFHTLNDKSWSDLINRRLTLNSNAKQNKISERVEKYMARGFSDCTGSVECPIYV